jgi:hypothetical protein
MPEILLTKADFQPFKFLSTNLDFDAISPYILEAQRSDLADLLGQSLYYAFWQGMNPPSPAQPYTIWTDLLNGIEYTPERSTDPIYFYGVKPYLVYGTFARFLNKSQVKMTRAGAVSKRTDESEYIDKDTLDKLRVETDSFAELYKQNIIAFLNTKRADYPLWPYTQCLSRYGKRKGLRLRSVSSSQDYYWPAGYGHCCGMGESAIIINNIFAGGSGYVE